MTEAELLAAIDEEVSWASKEHNQRTAQWDVAIDYFYGKLPAPPSDAELEQGMSDIVSTDVADAIEAISSEIMPAFSGQSPVDFEPLGPEDEDQATLETQAVNHVVNNAGGYMAINMAVKDALLRRAGLIKVYWDRRQKVTYQRHQGVPIEMLPYALTPESEEEQLEVVEGQIDDDGMTASGLVKTIKVESTPRIDAVPLDEFLISANVASPNLEEARFKAHQRPVTRSDLIELGVPRDVAEDLSTYTSASGTTDGSRARDSSDRQFRSANESTDYVMVCESYYNIDWDNDGIAEMRMIVTAGGENGTSELLLNEPWDEQPFCLGVPYLGIYSWDGVSMFDKLKMIQDTKTDMIREVRNSAKRNLRQRVGAVEGDANVDDLMTSMMGGVVRCESPGAVFALPDVQTPPQTFQFLDYLDRMRKDKGGGAIDTAAQANALAGDTAHGLERMMSAAEQINAMVAKNLTETMVKALYRKMHKLLRQYQADPIMLPGSAGWTATEPQQWTPRTEMVVSLGMSVGERGRRSAALQGVIANQNQDSQAGQGGVLVSLDAMYQARLDLARMSGLPNPEQYYLNPNSPESQQQQQQQEQQEQQAQQQQQQQAQQMMSFQYSLMTDVERVKNEGKLQQQQMSNQIDELNAAIKLFAEQVKLVGIEADLDKDEAQRETDKLQMKAATTQVRAA